MPNGRTEGRHALYFVGAGLTKALEAQTRVPLMTDFVAVLSTRVERDDVVLQTLSGLDRAGLYSWPLDSARQILSRCRSNGAWTAKDRAAYSEILRRRPSENIEELLDRALDRRGLDAEVAPMRFMFAINAVFSHLGWNVRREHLDRFLQAEAGCRYQDQTFVSFNYDLILDRCLAGTGGWSIRGGYGFTPAGHLDAGDAESHAQQFEGPGGSFKALVADSMPLRPVEATHGQVVLLKPHGSLNWLVPFEGNYQIAPDATVVLIHDGAGMPDYWRTFDALQVRVAGREASNYAPFLVPPSHKKNMTTVRQQVLERQRLALASATDVFLLGWSLPATDGDQIDLISSCVLARNEPLQRLVIVNYGATADYYHRVASLFGLRARHEITLAI